MTALLYLCIYVLSSPVHGTAETITVPAAVQRALNNDQTLAALNLRVKEAQALTAQAGRGPNPEMELELENLGTDALELRVTQPVELGGKKRARTAVADITVKKLRLEHERRSRELTAAAYRACVSVTANRTHRALIDSTLTRADETVALLEERVRSGAGDPLDIARARLDRSTLMIERTAVEGRTTELVHELAALWNTPDVPDISVSGELNRYPVLPPLDELQKLAAGHPGVTLAALETEHARADRNLARAEAVPGLALGAGYARANTGEDHTFILSAAVDLPLFNRNRDAVTAIGYRRQATERIADGIRNGLTGRVSGLHDAIDALDRQLALLETDVLPVTAALRTQLNERHSLGAAAMTDVLNAANAELDARLRALGIMAERALLYADLLELTGHDPGIFE